MTKIKTQYKVLNQSKHRQIDENNINNQSLLSQEDLRINKDVINAKKQEEEEKKIKILLKR